MGRRSWVNSAPLTRGALRGHGVFVEFWTCGCYNCKNVIPDLRDWHVEYEKEGLTIQHAPGRAMRGRLA